MARGLAARYEPAQFMQIYELVDRERERWEDLDEEDWEGCAVWVQE